MDESSRDQNEPKKPETLPEIAELLLSRIALEPLSGEIVIGGGIALKHYADFRQTQDIDAWWRAHRNAEALDQIVHAVSNVAEQLALDVKHRHFGVTDSLELMDRGTSRKVFSFQIAVRDVHLEETTLSAWDPIRLETLRENIGSKMNALVNRGAPRDFLDIFEVVNRKLLTVQDCWNLWQAKNPQGDIEIAKVDVVTSLERIAQRRPLAELSEPERVQVTTIRNWFRNDFTSLMQAADDQTDLGNDL